MKAYSTLEDVHPTLWNKPSGLKSDWHNTAMKSSTPRQQASNTYAQSSSSSVLTASPVTPQPPLQEFEHMSLLLALSPPPIFSKLSSLPSFCGTLVPLIDEKAVQVDQEHTHSPAVCIFSPCITHGSELIPLAFRLALCLQG